MYVLCTYLCYNTIQMSIRAIKPCTYFATEVYACTYVHMYTASYPQRGTYIICSKPHLVHVIPFSCEQTGRRLSIVTDMYICENYSHRVTMRKKNISNCLIMNLLLVHIYIWVGGIIINQHSHRSSSVV